MAVGRGQGCLKLPGQKIGLQTQVDKAGTGHFGAGNHRITGQGVGHFLCQLTRVLAAFFGRRHHAVDLKIAQVGIFGGLQYQGMLADANLLKGCLNLSSNSFM